MNTRLPAGSIKRLATKIADGTIEVPPPPSNVRLEELELELGCLRSALTDALQFLRQANRYANSSTGYLRELRTYRSHN